MSAVAQGRRGFLKASLAAGLVVAITPLAAQPQSSAAEQVLGWVRIGVDGAVTVLSNTSEIGQGTGTAIAQILADELDLDWRFVAIAMAPLEKRYFNAGWNTYGTFGSGGVARQIAPLRKAGAQARAMLMAAAARHWQVPAAQCDTQQGTVVHRASGRRLAYAKLVETATGEAMPADPPLMPRERLRFIGKSIDRLDIPAKTDGSAVYGVDVVLPGLLTATIKQCPRFGGRLAGVATGPALKLPGVRHVVQLDDAVAVVADSYWQAKKGLDALQPEWNLTAAGNHSSGAYMDQLRAAVEQDGPLIVPQNSTAAAVRKGYAEAMDKAQQQLVRVFSVPFLAHATMEPMNATAHVSAKAAQLWVPTQSQAATRDAVAAELGLDAQAVTVNTTLCGGGFGRRLELDFALQAVRIARQCKVPVKLIWSREEDMQHGFYRPAAVLKLRAGLGSDGTLTGLRIDTAAESLFTYTRQGKWKANALPVDASAIGKLPNYYTSPAIEAHVTTVDIGVPVGFWRAVAASQCVYAYECLIDELAILAQADPIAYRKRMLTPGSREQHVLDLLAERANWQRAAPAGRGRGTAFSCANGSIIAHVVEVEVDAMQRVKIYQVHTVIDCGMAVNPHNVRAQIEGSIVFALTAAFYGEITLRDGAVEQSNFHDYRLLSLAETPPMDILIVDSAEKCGGVGEEAVGGLLPALVNALFAATGKRIYSMPLSKDGFSLA